MNPTNYILQFNDTDVTLCTSHGPTCQGNLQTGCQTSKTAGPGWCYRVSGKALSHSTACSCFPSQAGCTAKSHQPHCSSGNVHVQKARSYLMGKDGRGAPEGMWGNRRGFSSIQVPNGNTHTPSCLGRTVSNTCISLLAALGSL